AHDKLQRAQRLNTWSTQRSPEIRTKQYEQESWLVNRAET
ncbi:50_t:CDS:2, partial [Entrophospora sp. SA101]